MYNPINFLAILYPTSLANLVVEAQSPDLIKVMHRSGAIWYHESWPTLVLVMTLHLLSAKPLPESMLTFYQLDLREKKASVLF